FRDQRWAKVSTEYDRRDRAECAANYGGELDDGVEEMSEMQRRASEREAEAKNRKPCQKKMYDYDVIDTIRSDFTAIFTFPFFHLIDAANTWLLILAVAAALGVGHASMYGPQASFFSELFDTRVRYTGASIGYQASTALAGGLAPIIATTL